jgi:hypothetical protein
MSRLRSITLSLLAAFAAMFTLGLTAAPAQAQATRTWVSGVGDDVNPCSRTAPCKTFAGAISKTAAGGEINCLDPGGFGTLTITKSITIDCSGTFGSVLNSGGVNGFIINDSATGTPGTITVRLRGLSIDGAGTPAGLNGIRFISGSSLTVENVFIQNQLTGSGISISPSAGTVMVNLNNVVMANSGSLSVAGVDVAPTGSAFVRLTMRDVQVLNSPGTGLRMDSTATTGLGILASIDNCEFTNGAQSGITVNASSTGAPFTVATVNRSNISNNASGSGIAANGSAARVRVANSMISLNNVGVSPGTGFINNLGGNILGNTTDGSFN